MTADINRTILTGRVTRDAELRSTQTGAHVLSFGLAFDDRVRNRQTGEWEDYPNFVDCTLFGERANALSSIVVKGMKVSIEGKLHYSSWEQQDGSKRSKLEVIVDEIVLPPTSCQTRQAPEPQAYQPTAYQAPSAPRPTAPQQQPMQAPVMHTAPQVPYPAQASIYDDDIPF